MQRFTERVIGIIQSIPIGTVMTYGQIAKTAGSPRGARQVVRVLHSMSRKYDLPWHRVINAKGEIALGNEERWHKQKQLLEDEGITVTEKGKVNLKEYQFTDVPLFEDELI